MYYKEKQSYWDKYAYDCEPRYAPCGHERKMQTHTHEFVGSTKLAEKCVECHNHRFAGVSGEAIPLPYGDHKHAIYVRTDFFGHYHFIRVFTGPAIPVGNGKHVHFAKGFTSINDGHYHEFQFATLIEDPLQHDCRSYC